MGKKTPPSGQGQAAQDGLVVGDKHDLVDYNTIAARIQESIDDLQRAAEAAKAQGRYAEFCRVRQALLLAQAATYSLRSVGQSAMIASAIRMPASVSA